MYSTLAANPVVLTNNFAFPSKPRSQASEQWSPSPTSSQWHLQSVSVTHLQQPLNHLKEIYIRQK
jgi:hypothetical protein